MPKTLKSTEDGNKLRAHEGHENMPSVLPCVSTVRGTIPTFQHSGVLGISLLEIIYKWIRYQQNYLVLFNLCCQFRNFVKSRIMTGDEICSRTITVHALKYVWIFYLWRSLIFKHLTNKYQKCTTILVSSKYIGIFFESTLNWVWKIFNCKSAVVTQSISLHNTQQRWTISVSWTLWWLR